MVAMRPNPPLGSEQLDDLVFQYVRRDYVPLRADVTVGEALKSLRSQELGEKIVYFYVVDADGRLEGIVPTRRLLMSDPGVTVSGIMNPKVVSLPAWGTVREASDLFLKHRFMALPVVDAEGHLHGIVDVSLFTDQLSEARIAEEAFQLIGIHLVAGLGPFAGFRDRFPWLTANIAGGLLAAFVTSLYESLLDAVVVLALFIPVVLALAESVSIQSVTLTLQSLRGPEQHLIPKGRSIGKEFVTALLLGLACGGVVGGAASLWQETWMLGLMIGGAITLSMITASVFGIVLPATLHWLRRDPTIAAGPIVLALADLATLIFYFNIAGMLLAT
jgi:magnesium transporter